MICRKCDCEVGHTTPKRDTDGQIKSMCDDCFENTPAFSKKRVLATVHLDNGKVLTRHEEEPEAPTPPAASFEAELDPMMRAIRRGKKRGPYKKKAASNEAKPKRRGRPPKARDRNGTDPIVKIGRLLKAQSDHSVDAVRDEWIKELEEAQENLEKAKGLVIVAQCRVDVMDELLKKLSK